MAFLIIWFMKDLMLRVRLSRPSRQHIHDGDQDHETDQQGQEHVLGQACHNVGQSGDRRAGHCIRDLRGYVIQVVALRAGRGHNSRIGDRGAVVAADGACHAGGHGDDHQLIVSRLEAGDDDRDQDTEGTPAGSGREGQAYSDQEDDEGQKACEAGRLVLDDVSDEFFGAEAVCHGLERPCEGQDQDGGNHLLEALGNASHDGVEVEGLANHVKAHGQDQGTEGAEHQTHGSVGVGKRFNKACSFEESACVDHADDTADNQCDDREEHVDNLAVGLVLGSVDVCIGTVFRGVQIAIVDGIIFMSVHGAVLYFHHDHEDHHGDGEQGVVVIRNGLDEKRDAVLAFNKSGNGGCPGGDRSDDADRSCGRVDQVGELGTGNLMLVGDRAHDAADGQTVKIVINEDQAAESNGGQLGAFSGSDLLGSPVAEGSTAAGAVHELDHDAQDDQEDQNTYVVGVRENCDDAIGKDVIQRSLEVIARVKQRTGDDSDEQGAVNFLGDQRERDRDDGRHQRPGGLLHGLRICHESHRDDEDHDDTHCDQ